MDSRVDKQIDFITQELQELANDEKFKSNFATLQALVHETAQIKGWHEPSKSFGEQIVMMHSELSEVIEAYRTKDGDTNSIWYSPPIELVTTEHDIEVSSNSKPEGVPIEFGDLLIRMLDTCGLYDINLFDATFMKALYNLQRSRRHGEKKL